MKLIQEFIHIFMNIGFIPITGITLPFISYGGSSLLVSMISIGITLNISNYNTGFKDYNSYARVTSPIIDRLSLINQCFYYKGVLGDMTEEKKNEVVLKLKPLIDKLNKNKDDIICD